MSKKLYFFTNSYPYGFGELWKTNELNVLVDFFDEITVIPFSYDGNKTPVAAIKGVKYSTPIFINKEFSYPSRFVMGRKLFLSKHLSLFLKEAKRENVFFKRDYFIKWLRASYKMLQIFNNKRIKNILSTVDKNTVLYFYWGREMSEVLPLLKVNCSKIVCRFHRYDLYKHANGGYIPYQYFQIDKVDYACACSDDGKKELDSYYPNFESKIITKRLGTISKGKARHSEDGILRILSCSAITTVKRIDIIARAILQLDLNIEWVHIGDGPLKDTVKDLVDNVENEGVKIVFIGQITNEKVIEYYANNRIDLFINVSESEGVPVTIMEALAAGIPVMATHVGGTGEIVNEKVGVLLPKGILPDQLAKEIRLFNSMPQSKKWQLSENAFARYLDKCEATTLAKDFSSFLAE